MLSNPTIKRSLEMLELEDGSNAYTYALSIYETLLSDEKSMHDIPVDTHTSHLITEL
jgi:ATP-dependent exoDNAse (exonuclease V) alpha subunit